MERSRQLSERIGELLTTRGETLAVAESSTGGLVGSLLTDIPGSSDYFDCSLVTYSNRAKRELLGVNAETISTNGAVSIETAREMALGVQQSAGTTWGLSTTGVAGPGGGTEWNPVGTIVIGVANGSGTESHVSATRYQFDGDRLENKRLFARQGLTDVHDALTDDSTPVTE